MTSIHDLTSGSNIKAADIQGRGDVVLTVCGFAIEEVGQEKERKCVAKFSDHQKGLVISAQDNVVVLLERFKTDDVEQWDLAAKADPFRVSLFVVPTNLGPGVRIKLATGEENADPLASFTPEQLAAFTPEQLAALTKGS